MRILHTMLRVGDLKHSIDFYTKVLGMKVLRQKDYPDGRFTLAFIGYGDEDKEAALELTHNWDTAKYDLGNGYGHVALEVDDAYKACEEVKKRGGKVTTRGRPDEAWHHSDCLRRGSGRLQDRIHPAQALAPSRLQIVRDAHECRDAEGFASGTRFDSQLFQFPGFEQLPATRCAASCGAGRTRASPLRRIRTHCWRSEAGSRTESSARPRTRLWVADEMPLAVLRTATR